MIIILNREDIIIGTSNGNVSINSLRKENKKAYKIPDEEFTPDMLGCKLVSFEFDNEE